MRFLFIGSLILLTTYSCSKKLKIGDPLWGLSREERERFERGREIFEKDFSTEEGLGPLFNSPGCGFCHAEPLTGGGSGISEVHATRFAPPDSCDPLFREGGPVIQQNATPLLKEKGIVKEGIPPSATGQGLRSTPPVFGFGLIDGIPEEVILANEDPEDQDEDGISGRANRFLDGRLGRFGRKAFLPDLFLFNAGAFPIDQGITTPLQPVEETVNGITVPHETDPLPEPEVQLDAIKAVTDFTRFLAPPPRLSIKLIQDSFEKKDILKGRKIFEKIGCANCHIPSMKTGPSETKALHQKTVYLFSDLLLHDMGSGLKDVCLGLATPSEFRTEMLMGLRFKKQFLHDGDAKTIQDAIERHGGEGSASRKEFQNLKERDQKSLLKFLETL